MSPKKKTTTEAPTIIGKAMLVNVRIGTWRARKLDAKATNKVNAEMTKNPRAGRYTKRLFGGGHTSHGPIVTAAQHARQMHYQQTLPWEDDGWRLLPMSNYYEYTAALREMKATFDARVEEFLADYPKLVEGAKELLGELYRTEDYPPVESIRRKFHMNIQFTPLPVSDDFRLKLPAEEIQTIAQDIESRTTQAMTDALSEAWTRLGDAISKLRPKLDDGKHLRATMIEKVAEVADVLGRLNVNDDPTLEKARKRILKDLATLDVETLREDDEVRNTAAKKADEILASMKEVYTPPKN